MLRLFVEEIAQTSVLDTLFSKDLRNLLTMWLGEYKIIQLFEDKVKFFLEKIAT